MSEESNGHNTDSVSRWSEAIAKHQHGTGEPLTDPDNELGAKPLTIPARVVETRQVEIRTEERSMLRGVGPFAGTAIIPKRETKHVITIVPQNRGNQAFQIEVEPGLFVAGTDIILTITKA